MRDECQICERTHALKKDGTLVNHGYRRPGCGWIIGNCYGVGHRPFPATSALVLWKDAVIKTVAKTRAAIDALLDGTNKTVWVQLWDRKTGRYLDKHFNREEFADHLDGLPSYQRYDVTWESQTKRTLTRAEGTLHRQQAELKRVEARIKLAEELS